MAPIPVSEYGIRNFDDKPAFIAAWADNQPCSLPYFEDHDFVAKLIPFQKLEKLRGTYVGVPAHQETNARGGVIDVEPTGFWKYIWDGRIHPSFLLHRTVTGRTASADPNAQNFPKRGPLAKAYRKIFVPTPGYVFVECDLSQAELRIAAWMADDPTMLKVYREGRDIHEATAAGVMGLTIEAFRALPDDVRKKKRQDAKAVEAIHERSTYSYPARPCATKAIGGDRSVPTGKRPPP